MLATAAARRGRRRHDRGDGAEAVHHLPAGTEDAFAFGMQSRPLLLAVNLAVFALAFGASGCSSAIDVHTATSPNTTFERYHTFTFDPAGVESGNSARSAEVRSHIVEDVQANLQSRGYAPATGPKADFVVRIETGRRPLATGEPAQPLPPAEQTDIPYFGFLDDERQDLVEGAFVVDAFDGETHRLLWHASAREVIDPTRANYDRLHHAVEKVMASFPARLATARP